MFDQDLSRVVARLIQLGFAPCGKNYLRDGLSVCVEPGWLTFRTDTESGSDAVCAGQQSRGLWKLIRRSDDRWDRVCDLPLETLQEAELLTDEMPDVLTPFIQMIDWVSTTRTGELPVGWRNLPRDELEALVPASALTLEVGPLALQGALVCDETRLTVSFPMNQADANNLPATRLAFLRRLLEDLQTRFRMVRLIESETVADSRSITAQIDLAGAPRFALPRLLRISVDALRYVVSQNLAAVELFANPTVTSTVWEVPSAQDQPAKGVEK